MLNDFENMEVLITGGTRGIGLATALEFAALGAQCTLTYSWGSVDDDEVMKLFEGCARMPRLLQADVAAAEDTEALFEELRSHTSKLDVLCANVAMSVAAKSLDDYDLRGVTKSFQYTTWPMVDYVKKSIDVFAKPPRYVLGYSCPGPDHYFCNYDMVALCKSSMETLARYLTYRLYNEDCHINVIRTEWVDTESSRGIFDEGVFEVIDNIFPEAVITPGEVGKASVAMCSGLMDAVRGQIINVDNGGRFYQNAMFMFDENRI